MMFSSADTLSAASICHHWSHWFHDMHTPAPFRGSFVDTMLLAAAGPAGRATPAATCPPTDRCDSWQAIRHDGKHNTSINPCIGSLNEPDLKKQQHAATKLLMQAESARVSCCKTSKVQINRWLYWALHVLPACQFNRRGGGLFLFVSLPLDSISNRRLLVQIHNQGNWFKAVSSFSSHQKDSQHTQIGGASPTSTASLT